jgi:phosphoribosylamine--glycine ligase
MKILFISNDLIAGDLARLMVKEGHEVKLFIAEKDRRENLDNIVVHTKNWKKELKWVGKEGLIVFDDIGYGEDQDILRKKGYRVFGGSKKCDMLESEREYSQNIFAKYGIETVAIKDFDNMEDAVLYVKKHPAAWVVKQNNHASKLLNYVGVFPDGKDVISVLKNYLQNKLINQEKITLQKRIDGVEIGVGRYFNGTDWVGPIEYNIEQKKFFAGDIGPTTSEMGTLAWYDDDENNVLYKETILKMEPFLREANFRGDFEINCIVNETGIYPLEATPRFGSPIIHLHSEIHESPWGEFLSAIADGEQYPLKWKRGYGIVVVLAVPPFPYTKKSKENISYGLNIYFDGITAEEMEHIHFEEVALRNGTIDQYYISDNRGYILYVTGMGKTVKEAQEKTYTIINKIVIPKMIYRNDIGKKFIDESEQKLREWGYLK